ncbi:MAG: hypothetical protein HKN32_01160 [Flavobacteriales bacterium]|nr:hypothetical protein [Flavobacteriales bacterium]
MKIDTFQQLPLDEKTNYLWDRGVCLNQRLVDENYIVCIFSLDDFFVEAVYSKANNRVNSIAPIVSHKKWEAYVDVVILNLLVTS